MENLKTENPDEWSENPLTLIGSNQNLLTVRPVLTTQMKYYLCGLAIAYLWSLVVFHDLDEGPFHFGYLGNNHYLVLGKKS